MGLSHVEGNIGSYEEQRGEGEGSGFVLGLPGTSSPGHPKLRSGRVLRGTLVWVHVTY